MQTMSRFSRKLAVVGFLVLASATWMAAQGPMRRGRGMARYDPATETTLQGTVEEVKQPARGGMMGMGTHVMLKTDKETIEVHLGPAAFLSKHEMMFAKGDQIEVTGSRVKFGGADVILARLVKKGGKTLTLRNAQGIPEWSRGRRPA